MPKVSVYEHGNAAFREYEIGAPWQSRDIRAKAKAGGRQKRLKRNFRPRIALGAPL
jgi:hypothetical protein